MEELLGIHQRYLSLIVLSSGKPLLSLEVSPHEKKTMSFFKEPEGSGTLGLFAEILVGHNR